MPFRFLSYIFTIVFSIAFISSAQAQDPYENIIQINGVTITADSLCAVPGVTVLVKGKDRGVESSNQGVFSIVVYKGDTLEFSAIGFSSKDFVVPHNLKGHYFSLIQLMVQDTFYLPETIIRAYPTAEQFAYLFRNSQVPDDALERARKNTNSFMLRAIAYSLPREGRENQMAYQNIMSQQAQYYGSRQPMNVLSPLAWAEFFEAWKRGDYRKKKKTY
jgi:hypothetical protein